MKIARIVTIMMLIVMVGSFSLVACSSDEETPPTKIVEVTKEVEVTKVVEVTKEIPAGWGEPVKISQALGLTGPYATQHAQIFRAIQDYTRYINDEGGLVDTNGTHHPLELMWGDMKTDVPTSVSLYEKAVEGGALLHSAAWVAGAEGIRVKANKDKMPVMAMSPYEQAVMPWIDGYTMVAIPYYEDYICAYIDWFVDTQWEGEGMPKLAMVVLGNAFGQAAIKEKVIDYIEGTGVEIVATESVDYIPVDTVPNLLKIKNAGADFIWAQMVAPTAAVVLQDMRKLGLDIPIAGPAPATADTIYGLAGDDSADWITAVTNPYLGDDNQLPFVRDMEARYHPDPYPEGSDMYTYGLQPFIVSVEAIRLAMEVVPFDELKPSDVMSSGFDRMENFEVPTTPPVTYKDGRRYGQNNVRMVQIQEGGSLEFVSDWVQCPDVLGYEEYYTNEVAPKYK